MPRRRLRRLNRTVPLVALVIAALDLAAAGWARHDLTGHPRHLGGPLWLRLRFNSGVSFSLADHGGGLVVLITAAIALVALVVGLRAAPGLATAGFGLLLGGGAGNLVDRLTSSPPRVTDYVSFGAFPTFNLADAAITVGFVLLVVAALRGDRLVGP